MKKLEVTTRGCILQISPTIGNVKGFTFNVNITFIYDKQIYPIAVFYGTTSIEAKRRANHFLSTEYGYILTGDEDKGFQLKGVPQQQAEKIKMRVAFGEGLTDTIESFQEEHPELTDGEVIDHDDFELNDGSVQENDFNTEAEQAAYIKGLSDCLGWNDYVILTEK